jgi:hypothetical protein
MNKNMRKPKKIKILYKYIGDRNEEDRIESEKRVQNVYNMLFDKIARKLMKEKIAGDAS